MAGWLDVHLEGFVKPVLGFIPCRKEETLFSAHEMAVMKNMWRSVKKEAGEHPILLAGRDVFIFEILARREGFPTIFRPDISRLTVSHIKEDYSGHFLFDTGFAGSIPKGLGSNRFLLGSSSRRTSPGFIPEGVRHPQVFPRMRGSRSLILKIENQTPKYWKRAFYREDGGIGQELSSLDEFEKAAQLTIQIFTDSSPKFVEGSMKPSNGKLPCWLE